MRWVSLCATQPTGLPGYTRNESECCKHTLWEVAFDLKEIEATTSFLMFAENESVPDTRLVSVGFLYAEEPRKRNALTWDKLQASRPPESKL